MRALSCHPHHAIRTSSPRWIFTCSWSRGRRRHVRLSLAARTRYHGRPTADRPPSAAEPTFCRVRLEQPSPRVPIALPPNTSRRRQIPIASHKPIIAGAASRGFLPWRLSDAGPMPEDRLALGPASETLHISGNSRCFPRAGIHRSAVVNPLALPYARRPQLQRQLPC
jgi:hypothetical protein